MNDQDEREPGLHLLAISGSLRSMASTTTLLQAAARLAPAGVVVELYPSVGDLPHFNPDLDGEGAEPPPTVADLRARLGAADAVLICAPEYAHGVPGALKNALDWVVSSGEFMHKPVALVNASATARHAENSLVATLTVMMAEVTVTRVPLASNKISLDAILTNQPLAHALRQVVAALVVAGSTRTRALKPES